MPLAHGVQAAAPGAALCVPAAQAVHERDVSACGSVLYLPDAQPVHTGAV